MVLDGLLDALRGGDAEALVDGECLLQVRSGLAGVALLQEAVAGHGPAAQAYAGLVTPGSKACWGQLVLAFIFLAILPTDS